MRHLLTLFDLTDDEVRAILDLAHDMKKAVLRGEREPRLLRKTIGMIFEKPSLRTRVSFEAGIRQMGGSAIFLGEDAGFGKREPIRDFSQVLSRFVDGIVCRAKSHDTVVQLAEHSCVPVINGLTDAYHPCQALADLLTIEEHFGSLKHQHVCYIGDANNVARSLVIACGRLHVPVTVVCPEQYRFDDPFIERMKLDCAHGDFQVVHDVQAGVSDATVVYTDVWASMGQEAEQAQREKDFAAFQVNEQAMRLADANAIFLHCLPAHRGLEVTAGVIDGPQSKVYDQAENRMHAQKAVMAWLMES